MAHIYKTKNNQVRKMLEVIAYQRNKKKILNVLLSARVNPFTKRDT